MAAVESEPIWDGLTPKMLSQFKVIYISYGSMDFQNRERIRQGEVIETFQNRPSFLRSTFNTHPYICISIDDYPAFQIVEKEQPSHGEPLKYTFVQIPSNDPSHILPITKRMIRLLNKVNKINKSDELLYKLYICNFIKFLEPKRYSVIELEGNNIWRYLTTRYSPYFYQWLGYSLFDGKHEPLEYGLTNWIYKQDCMRAELPLHKKLIAVPELMQAMRQGRVAYESIPEWNDCFINIADEGYFGLLASGGYRSRKRKSKKRTRSYKY
jgi:hypothetical protein